MGAARRQVEVCLHCGSRSPRVPAARCSHPEVALLEELRPEVVDLLTRIDRLENSLSGIRQTLRGAVELEVAAGRARLVEDPPVYEMANVEYLRPRGELANPDGSPRKVPRSEPSAPALKLEPPTALKPSRSKRALKSKSKRRPAPKQESLLEA